MRGIVQYWHSTTGIHPAARRALEKCRFPAAAVVSHQGETGQQTSCLRRHTPAAAAVAVVAVPAAAAVVVPGVAVPVAVAVAELADIL